MKIIDLLNKIANGEEVPKKIGYNKLEETENNVYTYSKKEKDYIYLDEFAENEYFFEQIFNSTIMDLNDEIEVIEEIIEEEKEIEKIDFRTLNTQKEKNRVMKDTINQLIDVINDMRDKENV